MGISPGRQQSFSTKIIKKAGVVNRRGQGLGNRQRLFLLPRPRLLDTFNKSGRGSAW
jgi:hypothetical protein